MTMRAMNDIQNALPGGAKFGSGVESSWMVGATEARSGVAIHDAELKLVVRMSIRGTMLL